MTRGDGGSTSAPRSSAGVSAAVTHPGYRRRDAVVTHDLESVTVLKKGLTVTGRVVNAEGRPVKGARAVLGHDVWGTNAPTGTTNERGEFTLENCDRRPDDRHSPGGRLRAADPGRESSERTPPVDDPDDRAGATVRGKVVNIQGKPVAGAFVAADTWRGHRSIRFRVNTDQDGRFEWRSAPKDVVLYDIGQDGYMASRDVPLTASDREQTVILYPKLVITGRVTDAETGRPVPRFRVVQGRPIVGGNQINWSENEGVDVDGRPIRRRSSTSRAAALYVRVEAPGYKPAESRAFRPTEGRQTFDFALRRAAGLSGVVLLPDGKPGRGRRGRAGHPAAITSRCGRADSIAMRTSRESRPAPTAGSRSRRRMTRSS